MLVTTTLVTALSTLGIKALYGFASAARQSVKQGTMARDVKASRVEPITLIDAEVANYERVDDLLHMKLNVFAAIYLQGLALRNTTVGGVAVLNQLSASNPTMTAGLLSGSAGPVLSAVLEEDEDLYDLNLPSASDYAGLESAKSVPDSSGRVSSIKSSVEALKDSNALSVGKVFNVELRAEGETFNVPVTIRLSSVVADTKILRDAAIARFSSNQTALERKIGWKTGRLSLINDILLTRDLIRNHYKLLVRDTDGIYAKLSPENPSIFMRAFASGKASIARASNIMVLSSETARHIEVTMGGDFSKVSFRQRLLEATGIMLLSIVDQDNDTVTLYMDTVADGTLISGRNLHKSTRNDGPDVGQILQNILNPSRQRLL